MGLFSPKLKVRTGLIYGDTQMSQRYEIVIHGLLPPQLHQF